MSNTTIPIKSISGLTKVILFYIYYQDNHIINKKDLLFIFTSNDHSGREIEDTLKHVLTNEGSIVINEGGTIRLTDKGTSKVRRFFDSGAWGREIRYTENLLKQGTGITQMGFHTIDPDVIEKELRKEYGIKLNDALKYFSNDKLRNILKRDILDAYKCLDNKLWKAAIILSGGIIEAIFLHKINKRDPSVLIKTFSKTKFSSENFNKQKFQHLIIVVERLKLFHTSLTQLSNVVRSFRNYVHIDRELKDKIKFDINDAEIAFRTMIKILIELTNRET